MFIKDCFSKLLSKFRGNQEFVESIDDVPEAPEASVSQSSSEHSGDVGDRHDREEIVSPSSSAQEIEGEQPGKWSRLWAWIKTKLPAIRLSQTQSLSTHRSRFLLVGSYIRKMLEDGVAKSSAVFVIALYATFVIPVNPALWVYLILFVPSSFIGKFWHRAPEDSKRFIALLARNFHKLWAIVPPLFTLGNMFFRFINIFKEINLNPGSAAMLANFILSIALSWIKFIIDKIRFSIRTSSQTDEVKRFPLLRKIIGKIFEGLVFLKDIIFPAAIKAGNWSFVRSMVYFFILSLFQQLDWVSLADNALPAAYDFWLYLIVIIPAAIQLSLSIAQKCMSYARQSMLEVALIYNNAINDGAWAFSIMTLLFATIVGTYQNNFVAPMQYFACMIGTFPIGIFMLIFSQMHAFEKRAQSWRKYEMKEWTHEMTEFLANTLYIKLDSELEGIQYAVIDPSNKLQNKNLTILFEQIAGLAAESHVSLDEIFQHKEDILRITAQRGHTRRIVGPTVSSSTDVQLRPLGQSSYATALSQMPATADGAVSRFERLWDDELDDPRDAAEVAPRRGTGYNVSRSQDTVPAQEGSNEDIDDGMIFLAAGQPS